MSKRTRTSGTDAMMEEITKKDKNMEKLLQHHPTSGKEKLTSIREDIAIEKNLLHQVERFDLESEQVNHKESLIDFATKEKNKEEIQKKPFSRKMGKFNDLTGEKFGMWNVIEKVGSRNGNVIWKCKCEKCGSIKTKQGRYLKKGIGVSCDCLIDKPYKHKGTLEKLVKKFSDNEIGKMFDVKKETIRYFRKKYNLSPCPIRNKKRPNKYSLDVKFFRKIENEYQAYILGFICADGYVHNNGKVVSIAIKQSDSQILEEIKKAMKTNAEFKVKRKPSNQEDLYVLNISSKELVNDLVKLGITSNKTKVLSLPVMDKDLYRHFFRGIFDGDGYVGEKQFALTGGSISILKSLQNLIFAETGQELVIRELKKNGYVRGYQLYGSKRDKEVLEWTYRDSRIRLERKFDRYMRFWKSG